VQDQLHRVAEGGILSRQILNKTMNRILTLTSLLTLVLASASQALTVEQLSQFLRICSWETHLEVIPTEVVAEVFEVADGKISKSIVKADYVSACVEPDTHLIIIATRDEAQPLHIEVGVERQATSNYVTEAPKIRLQGIFPLPKEITFGDYFLGGTLNSLKELGSRDIKDYKTGLLLRVSKKEKAKAQL
jgi:hypothetical protein